MHLEKRMQLVTRSGLFLIAALISLASVLAFWVAGVWVAWHFIEKYW